MRHTAITILLFCLTGTIVAQVSDNRSQADSPGRFATDNPAIPTDSLSADTLINDSLPAIEGVPWDVQIHHDLNALAAEANAQSYTTGFYVYDLTADSVIYGYMNNKYPMR